ncbi:biosynthesis C-methyltransferase UbiE [Seminavis robusta]|uniref:Biosynthesis C-methyltransferase UbiE n=1 Tax=Seminavis robusta TaxID=568900 RepID=A0A9N8HYN2_9STRA|nr:biosynthesis C-methyltransferase UbiE [Seminavis robusta]|eukprot:Sro2571_g331580.1 biosynthesis C-methyltransferase UbiE (292) ;mRNA; r:5545-6420
MKLFLQYGLMLLLSLQHVAAGAEAQTCSATDGAVCADDEAMLRPNMMDEVSSPDSKRALNKLIFTRIAKEYDFMTAALSFGLDGSWKRQMLAKISEFLADSEPPTLCVDLACGTGEISLLVSKTFPGAKVRGIDLTPGMIEIAKEHEKTNPNVKFEVGDMTNLTFNGIEDNSVDVITGGYAIRNAPDLRVALKEIHRMLKPGGIAAFLDFSRSSKPILSTMGYWALKVHGSFWGLVMHGKPWVYGYIADSLKKYPDRASLAVVMEEEGLAVTHRQLHMFGLLETVHLKKKV